ncbi:MAG: DUF2889 domain-containing protein [Myxococcota bacterium]
MSSLLSASRACGLPLHTRTLTVVVSRESDRLWRARGDVIDLRKNGCVPSVDDVQPAGIIHMMKLELDVDPDTLRLDRVGVEQPFVAVEPSAATGFESCRDPAPRLVAMAGERLDEGFNRRLGAAFGGALGCSHLLTLFQLMASTVPRALRLEAARAEAERTPTAPATRFFRRSLFVDGSLMPDQSIDVATQLTDSHTRPPFPGNRGVERLVSIHEVKAFARVERKRFVVDRLEAFERARGRDADPETPWHDHGPLVAPLAHVPILPGMARRIFDRLGEDESKRTLQDTLLQLAPGFIQITAALMDHTLRRPIAGPGAAADATPDRQDDDPATPSVAGIGGMPDSCYMWRRDSPYTIARREAMRPRD